MASYDYYGNKSQPPHPSQPYYGVNDAQSSGLYGGPTPPPYSSQQHLTTATDQPPQSLTPLPSRTGAPSPSPFDTPFDDQVYPSSSYQTPSSSQNPLSQQPPDVGYTAGFPRRPQQEESDTAYNQLADDIPLENRGSNSANKYGADVEINDHVYDAPRQRRPRKGRVRFGELGMLGAGNAKRIPFVVYLFSLIQIGVFIGEIVRNAQLTGSPIMTKPQFNPMIGPSSYVMINMGARFVPCMHNVKGVQDHGSDVKWPCPSTTTDAAECTLSQLCGFGGVPEFYNTGIHHKPAPNQWYRFIIPIFMHAGVIHIGFNLLLQLTMGKEMEQAIGSIRFFLVYMSAGVFGFVLGGNFAGTGSASTGASGSLFGVIALNLLDLLYSWKDRRSPVRDLMWILLDVIISFVLGLLPGLDNFSHIGGFIMGLCLGICVLHSPNALRQRIGDDPPYTSVGTGYAGTAPSFLKNPVGFFKGRKPLWWAWWLVRAGLLVAVIIIFIVLLNNFYTNHNDCSWCKYLSCIPVYNWCDQGNLQFTNQKRALDMLQGVSGAYY